MDIVKLELESCYEGWLHYFQEFKKNDHSSSRNHGFSYFNLKQLSNLEEEYFNWIPFAGPISFLTGFKNELLFIFHLWSLNLNKCFTNNPFTKYFMELDEEVSKTDICAWPKIENFTHFEDINYELIQDLEDELAVISDDSKYDLLEKKYSGLISKLNSELETAPDKC